MKLYESGDERTEEISKRVVQLLPKSQTPGLLTVLILARQSFFFQPCSAGSRPYMVWQASQYEGTLGPNIRPW